MATIFDTNKDQNPPLLKRLMMRSPQFSPGPLDDSMEEPSSIRDQCLKAIQENLSLLNELTQQDAKDLLEDYNFENKDWSFSEFLIVCEKFPDFILNEKLESPDKKIIREWDISREEIMKVWKENP